MVGQEIENEVGLPFVAHSNLSFDLMTHPDLTLFLFFLTCDFFFFLAMFYSSFCATYSNIVIVLIIN